MVLLVSSESKVVYHRQCTDNISQVLRPEAKGKLSLSYPLEAGIIENMTQMEAIWESLMIS